MRTGAARQSGRRTPLQHKALAHVAIAFWVPLCVLACYWQITIALAGDNLGWLYSIEWPVFGIFGIVVWWNLIHDDPATVGAGAMRSGRTLAARHAERERGVTTRAENESAELKTYNDYLATLSTGEKRKSWRQ
ncbi:MAG TPA: hypothetical protein VG368_03305 [Acidimicrobiales bacterium]|nr:hypothetical protein [Acidimicrobiales bacterium]